jgi:hypothetical protein
MAKKSTTAIPMITSDEPRPLRIGLIGYGFMGRAHANAIHQAGHFFKTGRRPVLQAVCGRNEGNLVEFAKAWQVKSCETDWRKLVARADIDAACRFLKQQELWVFGNGAGKKYLLLVATTQLAHWLLCSLKP